MTRVSIGAKALSTLIVCLFGAAACVAQTHAEEKGDAKRGHAIALSKCSRCHAVEPGKQSPVADAPPFYTFARMWPVEDIEEALAEGIMVGHEKYPMPVFQLEPNEIDDLVAYLKKIQVPAKKQPQ